MYTAVVLEKEKNFITMEPIIDSIRKDEKFIAESILDLKNRIPPSLYEKGYICHTESGMLLPHHMTINLGSLDEYLNDISILNQKVLLYIHKIACDHKANACAAKVEKAIVISSKQEIKSFNKVSHITMAIRPPGKPKNSNDIDWNNADIIIETKEPLILVGTVLELE